MTEPLLDFACYVGKYEIKQFDELPKQNRKMERARGFAGWPPPNMPYLVQVGPAELRKPKLDHLRGAVGHLLQTPQAKWNDASDKWLKAAYEKGDKDANWDNADELSALEKNVLLIARHIGMLGRGGPEPTYEFGVRCESLDKWASTARWIQLAFSVRDHKTDDLPEVGIGDLKIFLINRGQRVSLQIRPNNTHDALMYVAAMEIARGTASQTCDKCGTPFLEGGERVGKKRRGGARFCSDKCRYAFHYDARRKKAKP
jgi:hypothetical protein